METVARDTPARAATSADVGRRGRVLTAQEYVLGDGPAPHRDLLHVQRDPCTRYVAHPQGIRAMTASKSCRTSNHTSWRWVPALVRVPPGHRDATSVSRSAGRRRRPRTHRADRGPCLRPHDSSRGNGPRSEEHTSELQSRFDLVCRLLLEKKNKL